jgi:hypothetical protein
MTFDSTHYVPILRWKTAEVEALSKLKAPIREQVTPLLELCAVAFNLSITRTAGRAVRHKLPEEIIGAKLSGIANGLESRPVFIDLVHIPKGFTASDGRDLWFHILEQGVAKRLHIIPVTGFYGKGIEHQRLVALAARGFGNGACVRVFARDLQRESFEADLKRMLEVLQLPASEIDILVDLQKIQNTSSAYQDILDELPLANQWRTLTIAAGSFPTDLSHLPANDTYELERVEWTKWRQDIVLNSDHLSRLPTYSDYTIQCPIYTEPVEYPHVSASIRYTSEDRWIVFRGEWIGKKGGVGSAQYPAEAQLLVERKEYTGVDYSFGDEFMMQKALDGRRPGNPSQWLLAGINHHITFVCNQISTVKERVESQKSTHQMAQERSRPRIKV